MPQLHKLYPYTRISRHNAARGSPTVGWCNCVIIIAYQKRIGGLTLRRGVAEKADDVKHIDRGRREIARLDVGRVGCNVGRVKFPAVSVTLSVDKFVWHPLTSRANIGRSVHFRHASVFGSADQLFCRDQGCHSA